MDLLFVYGTLRAGAANHAVLAATGALRAGEGWIRGRLLDLGPYPGLVRSVLPGERVRGELWRLPDAAPALAVLDAFEGLDEGLFERVCAEVETASGPVRAHVYLLARQPREARPVAGGDWLERDALPGGGT